MGNYRVNGPVTYLEGRKVVVHTKPSDFAKIDDGIAAELGDKVSKIGEPDNASDKSAESKGEESKTDQNQPTRTEGQSKAEGARQPKKP